MLGFNRSQNRGVLDVQPSALSATTRVASPGAHSKVTLGGLSHLMVLLATFHILSKVCFAEVCLSDEATTAIEFIAGQQMATDLLESYSDGPFNLAHLFDQALALAALSHAGQTDSSMADAAKRLAAKLILLQDLEDKVDRNARVVEADFYGHWAQAYKATDASVDDPKIVTGPNAWAAYALWVYAKLLEPDDAFEAKLAALRFARFAIDHLRPIGYDYQFEAKTYDPVSTTIFSTEHNLDMFWLLHALGNDFTHDTHYLEWWAEQLYFGALTSPSRGYWDSSNSKWNRGSFYNGDEEDLCGPSDVQTWGSITSLHAGDLSRLGPPLDYLLDPANGLLHEEPNFPTDLCGTLDLLGVEIGARAGYPGHTIWNEGSGHAVSALAYAGRDVDGYEIMDSLLASKWEISGKTGWPHSIDSVPWDGCHVHFGPDIEEEGIGNHVGASSWVYFAIKSSEGDSLPFICEHAPYLVWIDFAHTGTQKGNAQLPFSTLIDAVAAIAQPGTIKMKSGATSETLTISKTLRLETTGGTVRIGASD